MCRVEIHLKKKAAGDKTCSLKKEKPQVSTFPFTHGFVCFIISVFLHCFTMGKLPKKEAPEKKEKAKVKVKKPKLHGIKSFTVQPI